MASQEQVRNYLAYWFQLGKKVVIQNGRESLLPQSVIQGNRYSPEFETCWQRILLSGMQEAYLEGTHQTIAELLDSTWEIHPCARCDMPVPMVSLGTASLACPCNDLPFWPDSELPSPRSPVDSDQRLGQIRDRLLKSGQRSQDDGM